MFAQMGQQFWSKSQGLGGSWHVSLRRFKEMFGCSPFLCSLLWEWLSDPEQLSPSVGIHAIHLLWALMFLKAYFTEAIGAALCGCDEKTYRKWVWIVVGELAHIDVVSHHMAFMYHACNDILQLQSSIHLVKIKWENRYINDWGGICRISLDGTDFRIKEPQPFNPCWYSHKFKGPGLRYEVAVSISSGWIVWTNGPFPCGSYPDLRIARSEGGIQEMMDEGEMYIADAGYRDGGEYALTPDGLNNANSRVFGVIRARHETINGRFKEWRALSCLFRHDLRKHWSVFMAIANITQIELEEEVPPFPL
jgi:hypothetical protein